MALTYHVARTLKAPDWWEPPDWGDLPVYMSDPIEALGPGVYLALFNGVRGAEWPTDKEDWGFGGPMFGPLDFVQTTYACHINFRFTNPWSAEFYKKHGLEIWGLEDGQLYIKEDCVRFNGCLFGDWTVFHTSITESDHAS